MKKRKIVSWIMAVALAVTMIPVMAAPAFAAGDTGVEFRFVDNSDGSYKLVFSAKTPTTIESFAATFSYDKNIIKPVLAANHATDFTLTDDTETVIALTTLPFTMLLKTPDLMGGLVPGTLFTMGKTLWRETTNREAFFVTLHKSGDKADSDGVYQDLFEFYFKFKTGYGETDITADTFKFGDFIDGAETIFDEFFSDPENIRVGIELKEDALNDDVYHWGYGTSTTATYPDSIGEVINPYASDSKTLTAGLTAGDGKVTLEAQTAEKGYDFHYTRSAAGLDADVNGDGYVDAIDLSLLLADFGLSGSSIVSPGADINGDGKVDATDLSILIANYGGSNPITSDIYCEVDCESGKTYYIALTGQEIADLSGTTFTIEYDPAYLTPVSIIDPNWQNLPLTLGIIPGANFEITGLSSGLIEGEYTQTIPSGQDYQGALCLLKFLGGSTGTTVVSCELSN